MKKTILFGIMFILLFNVVHAGYINGSYYDEFSHWEHNHTTYHGVYRPFNNINFIDADTLGGHTYNDIINNTGKTKIINNYGGGGIDSYSLGRFLVNDYKFFMKYPSFDLYLFDTFATKKEIEELNNRIDRLEALLYYYSGYDAYPVDLLTQVIRAKRLNIIYKWHDYTCSPNGCFKIKNEIWKEIVR